MEDEDDELVALAPTHPVSPFTEERAERAPWRVNEVSWACAVLSSSLAHPSETERTAVEIVERVLTGNAVGDEAVTFARMADGVLPEICTSCAAAHRSPNLRRWTTSFLIPTASRFMFTPYCVSQTIRALVRMMSGGGGSERTAVRAIAHVVPRHPESAWAALRECLVNWDVAATPVAVTCDFVCGLASIPNAHVLVREIDGVKNRLVVIPKTLPRSPPT